MVEFRDVIAESLVPHLNFQAAPDTHHQKQGARMQSDRILFALEEAGVELVMASDFNRMKDENERFRNLLAEANNVWRHEFDAEVFAAAGKLFSRLAGHRTLKAPKPCNHVLYKAGDADAPDSIKDRNGEVALSLCRLCGKGEAELDS